MRKAALSRAVKTVGKLRERRGLVGRAVRALDDEIGVEYLADRLRHEQGLIDRFVNARPRGSERVSIVVPLFGIPLVYLEELVQSIRAQTYENWEVCFCDDGDDNEPVRHYLGKLVSSSPRFKVARHSTNLGIAMATKTALGLATGTLVGFADEDDLLHPRALEAVTAAFAADQNVDMVYTDNDHATDFGHRRAPIRKPAWSPELLQCVNYVNHFVVARSTFLERCPELFGASTSGGQDWDLGFFAAERARKVELVPLPLYHWRKRPGSIADALGAKPWVKDACLRVRMRHLRAIDPRLTLSPADVGEEHRHHLEPDLAAGASLPRVTVLVLDALAKVSWKAFMPDYGGWMRVRHVDAAAARTNRDLLGLVTDAIRSSEGTLVFVVDGQRPQPDGNLARLIAYAIEPRVGCVSAVPGRQAEAQLHRDWRPEADELEPTPQRFSAASAATSDRSLARSARQAEHPARRVGRTRRVRSRAVPRRTARRRRARGGARSRGAPRRLPQRRVPRHAVWHRARRRRRSRPSALPGTRTFDGLRRCSSAVIDGRCFVV